MRRLVLSALILLCGLLFLLFLVPSGQLLPEALNAYYIGQPAAPLTLRATPYGLFLALGAALASALYAVLSKGADKRNALPFCAASLALGIVLARAAYLLSNLSFYLYEADGLAALRAWEGGMAMSGALLGGALCCAWFRKKGADTSPAAPAFALFVCFARLGERAAGIGYGRDVAFEGFFSVMDTYGPVLDVSRIEALFALMLCIALLGLRFAGRASKGDMAPLFFLLYGAAQILFESLRADRHMIWGFVKAQQIFALLFAGAAAARLQGTKKRALLSLVPTALLAAVSFGIEKALDRLDIALPILYGAYFVVLCAYVFAALRFRPRAARAFTGCPPRP